MSGFLRGFTVAIFIGCIAITACDNCGTNNICAGAAEVVPIKPGNYSPEGSSWSPIIEKVYEKHYVADFEDPDFEKWSEIYVSNFRLTIDQQKENVQVTYTLTVTINEIKFPQDDGADETWTTITTGPTSIVENWKITSATFPQNDFFCNEHPSACVQE